MHCSEQTLTTRRGFLRGGATLALWAMAPRLASAGGRDRRLLLVILRGGLDGLSMLAPVADPHYARHRGRLALSSSGDNPGLPVDGFFVLNPAMPFLHALYARREALLVHAVASPYRGRSHFDGQDVLESGLAGPSHADTGWLNRALTHLAHDGFIVARGLAVSPVVPLVMKGPAPVLTWSRPTFADTPDDSDTVNRLLHLYRDVDPALAHAFAEGVNLDSVTSASGASRTSQAPTRLQREFIATAAAAARLMTAPDGPRIGTLSFDGWDTHANEGAIGGTLFNRLAALDAALKAYADGLGDAWADACVVVVTEFGRTVRANGTDGTDHGTATATILAGGAVNGGRLIADWPGLAETALFEGRDLQPTRDLRAVLKGVLRDSLGLGEGKLAAVVFPDSQNVKPLPDLFRA